MKFIAAILAVPLILLSTVQSYASTIFVIKGEDSFLNQINVIDSFTFDGIAPFGQDVLISSLERNGATVSGIGSQLNVANNIFNINETFSRGGALGTRLDLPVGVNAVGAEFGDLFGTTNSGSIKYITTDTTYAIEVSGFSQFPGSYFGAIVVGAEIVAVEYPSLQNVGLDSIVYGTGVPEPSTLLILALSSALVLRRRRMQI